MANRKQLSKKLRFDVFKRDSFTCQYCGQSTPSVILEVDHIIPVKCNGTNSIDNLVTSCFDCNRGKGATELSVIPESIEKKSEAIQEKENQYKEFVKVQRAVKRRINKDIKSVCEVYMLHFNGWTLTQKFKVGTIKMFIGKLGVVDVENAMDKACSVVDDSGDSLKYFCGICWNKIKSNEC